MTFTGRMHILSVLLVVSGKDISPGNAGLQIAPKSVGYVAEFHSLTFSCSATNVLYNLVSWRNFNSLRSFEIVTGPCISFNGDIDMAVYNFSCSENFLTWTILNVTRHQHDNKWSCRTNDLSGTESSKTKIFVKVRITTASFSSPTDSNITVTENAATQFQCTTSDGRPRATIQWYISDGPVSLGTGIITPTDNDTLVRTVSTLRHSFNRTMNNRLLYCTAFNIVGQIPVESNRKPIIVEFPPGTPIFKLGAHAISGTLLVVEGDNIRIICESTSNPGPSYRWTGQSAGVNVLTINNIQTAGKKTCTATNTMKPTAGSTQTISSSAALDVTVMRGPTTPVLSYRSSTGSTTTLANRQLLVIRGTNFSLVCSGSTSVPAPSYRWSGEKASSNNVVSFTSIDTTDDGQYKCIVENAMLRTVGDIAYGNNSNRVDFEILTDPEINVLPDQIIEENQPLSVQCKANGNPQPIRYIWTRSRGDFHQTQATLDIKNTRRDDADIYICSVRNSMQPTIGVETSGVDSKRISVKILYHPDVNVYPLNGTTVVETATNIVLLCSAKGEPEEYIFYKWIQYAPDGFTKVREYESSSIEGGNAFLTFTSLSYMDSGIYHCFVSNGIEDYTTGNVTATNHSVQTVKGKPVVTKGEHNITAARYGKTSLWVHFFSNDGSDPFVKWYKINAAEKQNLSNHDGKFLLETGDIVVRVMYYTVSILQQGIRTKLLLQNISESDYGEYEVEIRNSIGITTWRFNVVAQAISTEDANTGAMLGGTIGGALAVITIVAVGIFVLRRGKGFPGFKRGTNSHVDSKSSTNIQETTTSSGLMRIHLLLLAHLKNKNIYTPVYKEFQEGVPLTQLSIAT